MQNGSEPLLRVENLSFSYDRRPVFTNVSFSIWPGDFAAIIGSNGSGKSTLIKLILGQFIPDSGRIYLFGQDLASFSQWHRIGYLPQGQAWSVQSFPATAAEVVETGLYAQIGPLRFPKRSHKKQVQQALRRVGMEEQANRLISQLSGGQRQRVMLARVLAGQPEYMILDEPATGIDEPSTESLYDLLYELNRSQNLTVLMVTHDVVRLEQHLNRIFCLENGSLIELSRDQLMEELDHRHKHPVNPDYLKDHSTGGFL